MGQQPHPGLSLPHLGGAEGAAAPPWYGCKDPKLTKKRGKHKKKNDKKLLKIKNIDKTRLKVLELAKLTLHAYGLSMVA